MDNSQRSSLIELDRLRNQKVWLYWGAMCARIIAVDSRNERIYVTLEEKNGQKHDVDRAATEIHNFVSRLHYNIPKEESEIDLFIRKKNQVHNKREYDIVSVWRIRGEAVFLVFSEGFSKSDFIQKNNKFRFAQSRDKVNAVYLIPDAGGLTASQKTKGGRLGIWCKDISKWLTSNTYNLEVVELAGVNVLKLVKSI